MGDFQFLAFKISLPFFFVYYKSVVHNENSPSNKKRSPWEKARKSFSLFLSDKDTRSEKDLKQKAIEKQTKKIEKEIRKMSKSYISEKSRTESFHVWETGDEFQEVLKRYSIQDLVQSGFYLVPSRSAKLTRCYECQLEILGFILY